MGTLYSAVWQQAAQYFTSYVVIISKSSQCEYATTQSSAEAYSGMPIACVLIMCPYLHNLEFVFGYIVKAVPVIVLTCFEFPRCNLAFSPKGCMFCPVKVSDILWVVSAIYVFIIQLNLSGAN